MSGATDNRILTAFVARGNDVKISQINGGVSKGLMSAKVTIGLDAFFAHSRASMMRQGMVIATLKHQ